MKDQFIPYEHAKMIKELGFNYPCQYYYNHKGEEKIEDLYHTEVSNYEIDQSGYDAPYVSKPLYQQAEEWLWNKFKIEVRSFSYRIEDTVLEWNWHILTIKHPDIYGDGEFISPISAHREGILKAIEHLHSQLK